MYSNRPIIGCTTYRKKIARPRRIDVYGLMPSYTEAIEKAGGIPLLIPLGLGSDQLAQIVETVDGLLLPGGGDVDPVCYGGVVGRPYGGVDPERDRTEIALCQLAVNSGVPFFAICRGLQVLNVALGGTLIEDIGSMHPNALNHDLPRDQPRNYLAHSVRVLPDSKLHSSLANGQVQVNSIHHQAIRRTAPGLKITAWAPDDIIEAAELPDHPFGLGVQWHPENLVNDDPAMLSLFQGFVSAAGEFRRARKSSDRAASLAANL